MALGCLRHLDLKAHATFAQLEHEIMKDSQNYIITYFNHKFVDI